MRMPLRWSLRALLIALTLIALGLGLGLRPYWARHEYLAVLQTRNVLVYTEPVGPIWLQRLDAGGFFERPTSALVLVKGVGEDDRIEIFGETMHFDEARAELLELSGQLGVKSVLASDFQGFTDCSSGRLYNLSLDLGTIPTPCGVSNFKTHRNVK